MQCWRNRNPRLLSGKTIRLALLRLLALVLIMVPGAGAAEEIYRSVSADGVASFTDFPVPGAEVLEVDPVPANAQRAQDSARLIEQQLEVAKALEQSRLARRKAETDRQAALAASQPQTIYYPVERDTGYWGWPGYGFRPGVGHRPGHPGVRPPYRPGYPSQPIAPGHGKPGHRPGGRPSISKPMITKP